MHISTIIEKNSSDKIRPLSSAEAPAGYPNKITNNGKRKKKARGGRWENKKGGSEVGAGPLPFPFPSSAERSIFPSPYDKKGPLRKREPYTREGDQKLTYLFRQQS